MKNEYPTNVVQLIQENSVWDPLEEKSVREVLAAWYSLPNPHKTKSENSQNALCSPVLISNAPVGKHTAELIKVLVLKPRMVYALQVIIACWCHNQPCTKIFLQEELDCYSLDTVREWCADLRDFGAVTIFRQDNESYVTPTRLILYRALEIITHITTYSLALTEEHICALNKIKNDLQWVNLDKKTDTFYPQESFVKTQ